jgi:thiamine-monophosphate kinase
MAAPRGAVLSIDGLTEGTHFRSTWAPFLKKSFGRSLGEELGWKLLGSGLSDLAAMGDVCSRWALIYLGAPSTTPLDFLMDFSTGVTKAARHADCVIAGGDTVRAHDLSLVVAVGGRMAGRPVCRSGAKAGDQLCVAGTVGDAAIGLRILDRAISLSSRIDAPYFVRQFFRPLPRFDEGRILARATGVTSLMDLSDPLGASIKLLLRSSGVGAEVDVDLIPVSAPYAAEFKKTPSLLSAGEDYGLLFTASAAAVSRLSSKMAFSVIGEIRPRQHGLRFTHHGKRCSPPVSFEHFQ